MPCATVKNYSLALCCLDQFLACTGQLLEKRILSQMDMLRNH